MRRRIQVEAEKPQFCVTTGITFAQADAWFGNTVQDLKLDLIYPRDNTRKYPCVVWICGGAWIQMDRSAHLAYLSVLIYDHELNSTKMFKRCQPASDFSMKFAQFFQ